MSFLGLLLSKTNQYKEAIWYIEKVIKTNPSNELFSLSLYLNYIEVNQFEMAFKTLFRFLENSRADMFKDTLEELVDGLLNGYGENYQNQIIFYAIQNNIPIPKGLLQKKP
jgi:hypothetical protein